MIDPYKGVRDFYPEDQRVRTFVMNRMCDVCESYGYESYDASVLEPTELYTIKSNAEMVAEETYTFEDRGGRSVTLRPEMTPTVARMVAGRKRELGYPLRWYSIPNLFRYDRPQRGRYREHWQLNADLFGEPGPEAEVEIIAVAHAVFTALGATSDMFEIRINNRNTMQAALTPALKDSSKYQDVVRLIDKKGKLDPAEFQSQWDALVSVPFDTCMRESAEIGTLVATLRERGVTNARFDPTIARGFDYYTGMVFEITDTHPDNRTSLAGGGRYDNLVELYGSEPVPVVGFGMGVERVQLFLETHGLSPNVPPAAELYLAPLEDRTSAAKAADILRAQKIHVALGMKHDKVGDHIKAASKLGIPYFAAWGENEDTSKNLTIKNLASGAEKTVALDKAHEFFLGTRN